MIFERIFGFGIADSSTNRFDSLCDRYNDLRQDLGQDLIQSRLE